MYQTHPSAEELSQEFSRHAVIQPPEIKTRDVETRSVRILIDSRDRDRSLYPSANSYCVSVPEDVRDVISVELLSYDVPFNDYNITEKNNVLHTAYMNEGQSDYDPVETIVIPPGKYTAESLETALNHGIDYDTHPQGEDPYVDFDNDMDRADPLFMDVVALRPHHIPIKFWYDSKTMKMYVRFECLGHGMGGVSHRGQVKLLFGAPNSIGATLGYPPRDMFVHHTTAPYTVPLIPEHPVNLKPDNYVTLYLEHAKRYMSTNHHTHQSFATIRRSNDENGAYVLSPAVRKRFSQPIPALTRVKVKFKSYDGALYDFQNKEHCLELMYVCYKQTRDYGVIFSEH